MPQKILSSKAKKLSHRYPNTNSIRKLKIEKNFVGCVFFRNFALSFVSSLMC